MTKTGVRNRRASTPITPLLLPYGSQLWFERTAAAGDAAGHEPLALFPDEAATGVAKGSVSFAPDRRGRRIVRLVNRWRNGPPSFAYARWRAGSAILYGLSVITNELNTTKKSIAAMRLLMSGA
jgi:hypothetical protein